MADFDPRITPARAALAAKHLEGKVDAARFVEGWQREVIAPQAPLRQEPSPDAPLDTEAIFGERVTVYEEDDEGWSWVQLCDDGYVGWVPSSALAACAMAPTHRVVALRTFVFPGPSIKLPPVAALPLGSRIAIEKTEKDLAVSASGFLPARHLRPVDHIEADFVAVAERFLGTPYLWGGKTALGIDCSGLVQVALTAAGQICPRDSDMQERALGRLIVPQDGSFGFERGDLVFWPGHVAIVRNADELIHANAFHMAVAIEPIGAAIERIRASGTDVKSVRRMTARV